MSVAPADADCTPGSPLAVMAGCSCNPDANYQGRGVVLPDGRTQFAVDPACPLHGLQRAAAAAPGDVRCVVAGRDNVTAAGDRIGTAPDLDLGPSGGSPDRARTDPA